MDELESARRERDEEFNTFMEHSAKATKHDVRARAARHRYILASDRVRSLERDLLAFPVQHEKDYS